MSYYKETLLREWSGQMADWEVVAAPSKDGGRRVMIRSTLRGDHIVLSLTMLETAQLSDLLRECLD